MENKLVTDMDTEEKKKEALSFLQLELGIISPNEKELTILLTAIEYAGLNNYCEVPLSKEERFFKEKFTIKAIAYFKRKILTPLVKDYIKYIRDIEEWEYYNIHLLKSTIHTLNNNL